MSENTELLSQLAGLLKDAGADGGSRRGRSEAPAVATVGVPVKATNRDGDSVRCYVHIVAPDPFSPRALEDAIDRLEEAGFQVDAWGGRSRGSESSTRGDYERGGFARDYGGRSRGGWRR